jgi:hypothetical protein
MNASPHPVKGFSLGSDQQNKKSPGLSKNKTLFENQS